MARVHYTRANIRDTCDCSSNPNKDHTRRQKTKCKHICLTIKYIYALSRFDPFKLDTRQETLKHWHFRLFAATLQNRFTPKCSKIDEKIDQWQAKRWRCDFLCVWIWTRKRRLTAGCNGLCVFCILEFKWEK